MAELIDHQLGRSKPRMDSNIKMIKVQFTVSKRITPAFRLQVLAAGVRVILLILIPTKHKDDGCLCHDQTMYTTNRQGKRESRETGMPNDTPFPNPPAAVRRWSQSSCPEL